MFIFRLLGSPSKALRVLLWVMSLVAVQAAIAAEVVLVLGDSLSAGYGIARDASWPALLEQRLRQQAKDYMVVNASISGETTAGGRSRLKQLLQKHQPALVIIALGGNDGLRGLDLRAMRANLLQMVDIANASNARVMLVGMRLPPNFGAFANEFRKVFDEVARARKLPAPPFLLEGIAEQAEFFQDDAIHPNAMAQVRLLDNVWPTLLPFFQSGL